MRFLTTRALRTLILPSLCLCLSTAVSAQSATTLLRQGQDVYGVGSIGDIFAVDVNDNGEWLARVNTSGAGVVLLRNGIPVLQVGDDLGEPVGASVKSMDDPSFNNAGDVGWVIDLNGVSTSFDSGAYCSGTLLCQEGRLSSAARYTPGTIWVAFYQALINDQKQVLITGQVDDPMVTGTTDYTILRATLDEYGQLAGEECLLLEADPIPGAPGVVLSSLNTTRNSLAINNRGDWLSFADGTGSTARDGFLLLNGVPVLREGDASPVSGRNWENLGSPELDLNDRGDWVVSARLVGVNTSDWLIAKNNEKIVQEDDVIPSIAPFTIESFYATGVLLSNAGNVFWFCLFNDANPDTDRAYFMNEDILVRSGVTWADGMLIADCRHAGRPFEISPNGRYYVFIAELPDGKDGIFMMDLGVLAPMDGCSGNQGKLSSAAGLPLVGTVLEFQMDDGQAPGVIPLLAISTAPTPGWDATGCGLVLPFGELLIDINGASGNPVITTFGPTWGGAPVSFFVSIPDDPALIGASLYTQGLFWDLGDLLPEDNLMLTNAMVLQLAAP
jgi:hypothetical protein